MKDTQTYIISGADLYFKPSHNVYTTEKVKVGENLKRPPFWFNTKIDKFAYEKRFAYKTAYELWTNYSAVKDKVAEIATTLSSQYSEIIYRTEINQRILIKKGKKHLLPVLQNIKPEKKYRVTIDYCFEIFSNYRKTKNFFGIKKKLDNIEEVENTVTESETDKTKTLEEDPSLAKKEDIISDDPQ